MKVKKVKNPKSGRQKYLGDCTLCKVTETWRWYHKLHPEGTICANCYISEKKKDEKYVNKVKETNKKWSMTYNAAEKSARSKGMEFDISKEDWINITQTCGYCRKSLKNQGGVKLDRIDNSKHYTKNNVMGCCRQCNVAKNNYSFTEFSKWISQVYYTIFMDRSNYLDMKKHEHIMEDKL